ncbi:MAG: PDGLE domain-containing protein [Peptococcaceae bacterium]|nr:PDGLE domain-containing protein [Peptococcaceae bacterium]
MKKPVLLFLLVALAVAAFLSPFASPEPDGLDRVAQDLGVEEKSEGQEVLQAPVPDYKLPGVENEAVATALAGVLGTLVTFGVAIGLGKVVAGKKNTAI